MVSQGLHVVEMGKSGMNQFDDIAAFMGVSLMGNGVIAVRWRVLTFPRSVLTIA